MTPRALLVAVIVALTGCGGGGDEHSDFRAATDCLANRGNLEVTTTDVAATEHNIDYIAMAASEGGAEVEFTGNRAVLAFERNGSDAEDTMDAYRVFDGDDGKLERKGNVVIAWDKTPSEGERGQVHDCLGDAAE